MPIFYCKNCIDLYKPKANDKSTNQMCFHFWLDHIKPKIDKQYKKILSNYKTNLNKQQKQISYHKTRTANDI